MFFLLNLCDFHNVREEKKLVQAGLCNINLEQIWFVFEHIHSY